MNNFSFYKVILICLSSIFLLTTGGIIFADANHTLDVTGVALACQNGTIVHAGNNATFSWTASNDNAVEENREGYYPIDIGDDGSDPSGSLQPYQMKEAQSPGDTCDRYDTDVAFTSSLIEPYAQYLKVIISNAYPYYHPTVFFGLNNRQSSAGRVDSILIDNLNPDYLTVRLNGIRLGQIVESGTDLVGSLDIQLEQSADQNQIYVFDVSITLLGKYTSTQQQDMEGTPGFWRNNWISCYSQSSLLKWLKEIDNSSQWIDDPTGCSWTIEDMNRILDAGTGRQATDKTRFLRHYLTTRLNICAERLNLNNRHNLTYVDGFQELKFCNPVSVSLSDIVTCLESQNSGIHDKDQLNNIMKNICDDLNNLRI